MKNCVELIGLVVVERDTQEINRYEYFSVDNMPKAIARVHKLHSMAYIDCTDMIFCDKYGCKID